MGVNYGDAILMLRRGARLMGSCLGEKYCSYAWWHRQLQCTDGHTEEHNTADTEDEYQQIENGPKEIEAFLVECGSYSSPSDTDGNEEQE